MSVVDRIMGFRIASRNVGLWDAVESGRPYTLGESRAEKPASYLDGEEGWVVHVHWTREHANWDIDGCSTREDVLAHLRMVIGKDEFHIAEEIFKQWSSFLEEIPEDKGSVFVWKNPNPVF